MGLRLLKDLTDALCMTVDPQCRIRLNEADLPTLRAALRVSGLASALGPGASNQLLRLVRQYDVYLLALSAWLVIPLPSWISTIDGGRGEKASAHVGQMVADRTPNSACTNAAVTRLTL